MFRNLSFYRVTSPWPASVSELTEILENKPFTPCSKYAERSAGWVSPTGHDDAMLGHSLMGADLVQLRTQSRVLPPAAIREALEERVASFRERVGTEPPRREIRKLKEEVRDELMPRSLVKSDLQRALFLAQDSLLVIDSATASKSEWLIDHLRFCFNGFACHPLAFEQPVSLLMKKVFMGQAPRPFGLGRECRMQDPTDASATGAWRNVDLDDQTIRHHVKEGFRLTHLELTFDEVIRFVISDEGVITKLKIADSQVEQGPEGEDALAVQDAELALLVRTLRRLMDELSGQLGGIAS